MHEDTNALGESEGQGAGELEVTAKAKLEQVMEMREIGDFDRARPLLYDVLTEGDESQVKVAMRILAQLDA